MRLAYLDPHAVPDTCPEALQILHTVDALGEIGVDVLLVTPRPQRGMRPEDILGRGLAPSVRLQHLPDPRKRWWFPFASNRPFYFLAARALRRLGAEIVLTRNLKMAEHLLRHVPEIPLVFETHELFAQTYREEHPNRSFRQQRKLAALTEREAFVYRRARGLLALTPMLVEDIRAAYGVDTPTVVVPDGVDLELARSVKQAPPRNDPPLLLYLGSLHPWKGVQTLIEAMPHLKHPARLQIVGGNELRIGELRALAQRLGVSGQVMFSGPCPPARRFDVIQQADICLLPLTATSIGGRYTSPLKLFEYLAIGKPVVASDLPSMRSVLEPGKHALLVKAGNVDAFATAINRLLAEPALGKQLGEAARAHARHFSWVERGRRVSNFCEGLKLLP